MIEFKYSLWKFDPTNPMCTWARYNNKRPGNQFNSILYYVLPPVIIFIQNDIRLYIHTIYILSMNKDFSEMDIC